MQGDQIRVELPEDLPDVLADPGMVERIVANLISNALKYGREGGDVVVRAAHREGEVVVSVTDEGPGIAPEHLPRIFERYYRVEGDQAAPGWPRAWPVHNQGTDRGDGRTDLGRVASGQGHRLPLHVAAGLSMEGSR